MRLSFTSPLDRREAKMTQYNSPAIALDEDSDAGSDSDVSSNSDSSLGSNSSVSSDSNSI